MDFLFCFIVKRSVRSAMLFVPTQGTYIAQTALDVLLWSSGSHLSDSLLSMHQMRAICSLGPSLYVVTETAS